MTIAREEGGEMGAIIIEHCKVKPPVYWCSVGETVWFGAPDSKVELYFPDPEMWESSGPIETVPAGGARTFVAAKPGTYDYGAVCKPSYQLKDQDGQVARFDFYEFAQGNSVPRIIINR